MLGNKKGIIKYLDSQDENKLFEIKEYKAKRTLTQNRLLLASSQRSCKSC